MVQLFTSQDAGVRKAADLHLMEEKEKKRLKFQPAALVDSIHSQHPPRSHQGLTCAAKTLLGQEEDDERHQSLWASRNCTVVYFILCACSHSVLSFPVIVSYKSPAFPLVTHKRVF